MRHKTILKSDIEVWNCIYVYKMGHGGNSPSIREIVKRTTLKSTSHVLSIIKKLEEFGFLKYYGIRQIELSGGYYSFDHYYKPELGEVLET